MLDDDEEQEHDEVYWVWRENSRSLGIFLALGGQWLRGLMGEPVALNYAALDFVMRMMRVKPRDQSDVFFDVRAMERAALKVWLKQS